VNTTNVDQNGGAWSTSELIFSGTEDLGGGLKASFRYSEALNINAGTGAGRDGWIALEGGFGKVQVGRMNTAVNGLASWTGVGTTNTQGSVDSFGADIVAGTFANAHTVTTTTNVITTPAVAAAGGGMQGRTPGVIQYTTPSFSGIRVTAELLLQDDDADGTDNDGSGKVDQKGLVVSYSAGPFAAAFAYGTRDREVEEVGAGADNLKAEAKLTWLGASYDLGIAKLFAAYASRKDDSTANQITTAIARSYDANVKVVGVNVPLGSSTLFASVYDGENNLAAGAADDREANGYQVGLRYNMSKRTFLYAVHGMDKNEDKTKAGNAQADSWKRTQSSIGVSHSF
jgi:predicted porin